MSQWLSTSFLYTLLALPLWSGSIGVWADDSHLKCASAQLDWYTDAVGETPCETYQKLRNICNPSYTVPQFFPNTPGDSCDDQVSGCCCNTVSFVLSMLCMNCQYDTQLGEVGIDAGKGAYSLYAGNCNPRAANHTLPKAIQQAVCNKGIKIDRNVYDLFWDTEDCVYSKETMVTDLAATNNNTFTKCASTTKNDTVSTTGSVSDSVTASTIGSSSTNAPDASNTSASKSSSKVGPVIGGVVGGVGGAIAIGVLGFFLWRARRQARGPKPLDLTNEYRQSYRENEMGGVTPFTAATTAFSPGSRYDSEAPPDFANPETHALLSSPSGPDSSGGVTSVAASKYGPQYGWSQGGSSADGYRDDDERHADGGPVPALARSNSGRLPPGYGSWESNAGATVDGSVVASSSSGPTEGQSAYGGSSTGTGEPLQSPQQRLQQQQYPRDLKARPPGM
ncbi:hypothetical protein K466DRAFT_612603 [Polyporus arcularius HHB13444]|uniref:Mid2 domain-containing protein n=1 Tax=Polyporus arcularius HHB13444 TaxID=1314778 RepID=A0A5C3NP61_9APHY|nr:hypothetical protein K466DRAFT_612603 [Polyporus arcularius HHB13444]